MNSKRLKGMNKHIEAIILHRQALSELSDTETVEASYIAEEISQHREAFESWQALSLSQARAYDDPELYQEFIAELN